MSREDLMEENMRDASRRPWGRLSCLVMAVIALALAADALGARAPQTSGMTTISDTVYMADGTPAQGTLLITWPAFVTASGVAVAGGNASVTLGAGGALTVQLEPNAGASPAGVYYTVVYQLGPSEMKTQYWVVPVSTTPVNLATVITTPGSGAAAQPVSMQYVNSALATKANDDAVVHLANAETITGVKSFTVNPNVPAPVNPGDVANKSYVDTSVSNVGSGTYLPTAGGTMTGPITLAANPAAAMQASTKQYVDTSAAAKANLVSGVVPANELGTGTSNSGSCLLGNGASAVWGACGGGTGTGNISTNPAASQAIAQPEGTQFSANNLANIRYVTSSWNWAQTPSDNLATPGSLTIHLAPCPLGLDTNSSANYYSYRVYISGTGTPEAAPVTGGTCVPGTSSGTITVTTAYAHASGYTVGSASTGIQEAWNDAWVNDIPTTPNASTDTGPYVKLAANTQYDIYATVFMRGIGGTLDGTSGLIVSHTRDRAIFVGTLQAEPYIAYHKIYNLTATTPVAVDGAQVASVSATSGTYTVTTAGAHPFVSGDTVDCEYHSQTADQHWMSKVLGAGLTATTFEVSFGTQTFAAGANTFGFCNIENAFIEDGSDHVDIENLQIVQAYPSVGTGYFNYGVVNDNDQQLQIERAANRGQGSINPNSAHFTATWPIGAFVYERADQGNAGITYIHKSELSAVNCGSAGGNGFAVDDTVCQGFPIFGFRYFGGLQPATFTNVYQEACPACYNPLYSGGNYAAQMGYLVQGSQPVRVVGTWPTQSESPVFATGGGSAAERTYFVVPRSSAFGYGPVLFAGSAEPASASVNINVQWPSVDLVNATGSSVGTLTWDVLVTTGVGTPAPWGSGMYAIATNVSGNCGTNGICSFTDTQAAPTAYTVQAQQFTPNFWFWPVNFAINNSVLQVDEIGSDPQSVASQGTTGASIVAQQCYSGGVSQRRTPMEVSCLQVQTPGAYVQATLLRQMDASGNGPAANSKGRLNFGKSIVAPNDLLTLVDSNVTKTTATSGERPSGDAGDLALGIDQTGGLAERAANSISSYINVLPNGTNFLERLTASAKTINVPLTVNGSLAVTSGTVTLPVTGSGNQCLHVSSAGVLSGTGSDCGSGSGGSGSVTVNTGVTSELALYSGNGTTMGGDSTLSDNGTTLNYTGTGGISATAGTFSGNLTVNGQLLVAGPWMVSSPVPGTAMGAASAGTSSLGISNDGNFYISANAGTPQKVATTATSSYFTNLTQEDGYDVGQFTVGETTANPQSLHVYSSYTNSSTWQRTSMGFDATDGYAVVRSENSTAGAAPGLGFWINNGLKWVIDPTSNLKPWTDQTYNIGTFTASSGVGLRPATVYVAGSQASDSGFELGKFANNSYELCNDSTNGTVLNGLAVLTTGGCAKEPSSASTSGVIGVVIANAGTSGTVTLVRTGSAYCSFDAAATVVGDYVVASTTAYPAGSGFYPLCHDAGAVLPSGAQILGRVLEATAGGTTAQMFFDMPGSSAGSSGVSSVFGRTGAVVAATGDYSFSQIGGNLAVSQLPTGLTWPSSGTVATTASPTFTGTVTEPVPSWPSQSANQFFASPNGSAGAPSFRAIAAADIPTLNQNTTGTAANLSGTPALPNGTTATTQTANDTSTKVATDAFVMSELPAQGSGTPWITAVHGASVSQFSSTANKASFYGVVLGFPKTTTQVSYYVATADTSSNTYDLGIFSGSSAGTCTLVAHTGSIAGSTSMTAGWHTVSWTGGSVTLQPGRYYLALTSSGTSSLASLYGDNSGLTFVGGQGGVSITTGGTLPATATCPTDSPTFGLVPAWVVN